MLSGRERLLAIGSLVVLGLLLSDRYLLEPAWALLDDLDLRQQQRLSDVAAARTLFEQRRRLAPLLQGQGAAKLPRDPAAAEAQALAVLQAAAGGARFVVDALRPERVAAHDQLRPLAFQLTGHGNLEQVARFLHALDGAALPLRVEQLRLSTRKDGADDLSLQLRLTTLYLGDAVKKGTK